MIATITKDLLAFLQQVNDEHYGKPCSHLSHSSIGQHVRHSIEMYQCLFAGYNSSTVDYSKRKRDLVLETSSVYAWQCLEAMVEQMPATDKKLLLTDEEETVQSSFKRELLYCNEHLIHHMALIKVAVMDIGAYELPATFGIAPSTLKYRQQCAQ